MIVVLGGVATRAGCIDEAFALAREHVLRSRAEPGCVSHDVLRDPEDPARLVFVERWASREALWAHFAVPASRAFGKALAALASEVPTIEVFDTTAVALPGRRE